MECWGLILWVGVRDIIVKNRWRRWNSAAVAAFRAKRFLVWLKLTGSAMADQCRETDMVESLKFQLNRETYCGRTFATSFALLVKETLQLITATTVLFHAFPEGLEKICAFKTHFTDGTCEANFT